MGNKQIMNTELVWAAGFYDGEGCFSFKNMPRKSGNHHATVRLGIRQNDRRPLDRFQNAVGFGKVYGPYNRKEGDISSNPYYVWESNRLEDVFNIIELLLPYLTGPKREQIWDNCIKYQIKLDEYGIRRR